MYELSPSFKMECEVIDRDHLRLLDMVNAIIAAIDDGRAGECAGLTPKFVEFAKQHFNREETFLTKIGYPDVKKHHEHHSALNDKMDTIIELANTAEQNDLARQALKKELVFFLMDDVINADLEFKSFVEEKEEAPDT